MPAIIVPSGFAWYWNRPLVAWHGLPALSSPFPSVILHQGLCMSSAPSIGVPELAGIASYKEATKIGYSVEENVRRLLRYHWVQKRLAEILISRIPETPEWEVKGGFSLHQYMDVEHANNLAIRIREMRHPMPRLDSAPNDDLEIFLQELEQAQDTVELLAGVYRVARADLVNAYRMHIDYCNPLVDFPTRRALRANLQEEEEALGWGARSLGALMGMGEVAEARVRNWERHVRTFLGAAGGVAGDLTPTGEALPPRRALKPRPVSFEPKRDARFSGAYNFSFPPHTIYNKPHIPAAERNLALLCKRLLEMDVPEMMASFITQERGKSWEFFRDYSRQLWDEARHSMMGEAAMEARGVDWTKIPLNVGFALRLNAHATPEERRLMLYGIEQSLMPGDTGKRSEVETAHAANDPLSTHFHDYDWADEVLHTQIGRRWIKDEGAHGADVLERAREIHEKTWRALQEYRDREPQSGQWWRAFVKQVLGVESAARDEDLEPESIEVITE